MRDYLAAQPECSFQEEKAPQHGRSRYHQLTVEGEHPAMVEVMGSGFWSRDTGVPRPTWWGQGDCHPPERLTSYSLPKEGPLPRSCASGGCAHHYSMTGPIQLCPQRPSSQGPLLGSASCLVCHSISRASGSQGFPDRVTQPTQCSSSLSYTTVMGSSPKPVVVLSEKSFFY